MINDIIKDNDLRVNNISYRGNCQVLDTNKGKFVLKKKKNNIKDIYEYLNRKKYYNYVPLVNNYDDPYEIYPFIEEKNTFNSSKAVDMIYALSMLHIKTTTYEEINLDEIKELYERTLAKIDYLYKYYLDLQDYIEANVYMAPAEYLLIRNISMVYNLLSFSKTKIDEWYREKERLKKERNVLLINNLKLEQFLEGEQNYFVNWSKAKRGIVIYDFLDFFKKNYLELDMKSLYDIYQSKYPFSTDEENLFLALLAIPDKIIFDDNNYINTIKVKNLVIYLNKVGQFISEENKEYQEENK